MSPRKDNFNFDKQQKDFDEHRNLVHRHIQDQIPDKKHNQEHEQEHKQEQKNKQLSHGKGAHKNEDDMIQVQYQVTPPKPTEIDNREYEWALRIKHGAKQKPKLEDIAERRTYWIYKENISYIDEIAEHSGLDKYEVVNMAVQQLYKWMKKQQ